MIYVLECKGSWEPNTGLTEVTLEGIEGVDVAQNLFWDAVSDGYTTITLTDSSGKVIMDLGPAFFR